MDHGMTGRKAAIFAASHGTHPARCLRRTLQLDGGFAEGLHSLACDRRPTGYSKLRRGFAP
jgi:hypothetical protein